MSKASPLGKRSGGPASIVDAVSRQVLVALEGVLTRAAVGAARTAIRLGGMARRHEALEGNAREVEEVTARMRADIEAAARGASETAHASARVATIAREGRDVSAQSMDSMRRLLQHTETTNEHLRALLVRVREVTGVSRVIDGIAGNTRLLALNASIEATRAGVAGRAFGVVAGEVRELAKTTAEKTKKIDELMRAIVADLEPARAAIEESRALAARTAERVEAVDQRLATMNDLADAASLSVSGIVTSIGGQSEAMAKLATATKSVVATLAGLREEARLIASDAFGLSKVTDEGMHQLAHVELDTDFHRGLALCRDLAARCGAVLDRAIGEGRCRLDDVLALQYREIKGAEIGSLARLFDVSRVPPEGFTPPKYSTAYDALVDVQLQDACDRVLGSDERLLFALPIDLNSYGPIHNRRYMKPWTGVPETDLAGNRVKRFFTDNSVLVRGARVGLGPAAAELPHRAARLDFQRTGCDLTASPQQVEAFLVQTYARDTGAFVTVVTVPIFVRGKRWGAGLVGWSEDQKP